MLLFALTALTATSCRIHREATHARPATPTTGNATDPDSPPAYVPQYYTAKFTCTTQGEMDFKVAGTTQGITANGQLRLQPDSVLWAYASKIIELGRARLTPDSVVVYAKVANSCFRGTYADLYRRFGYRTNFEEVVKMATADDAEAQIATLLRSLNLDATVKLEPWQKAETLNFPIIIPANAKPL